MGHYDALIAPSLSNQNRKTDMKQSIIAGLGLISVALLTMVTVIASIALPTIIIVYTLQWMGVL